MEVENGGNEATVTYGEKLYTYIYMKRKKVYNVAYRFVCNVQ